MDAKDFRHTQKVHETIMSLISAYCDHVREWDIEEEDDYSDLSDGVLELLLQTPKEEED